jgi:hypothetical protein
MDTADQGISNSNAFFHLVDNQSEAVRVELWDSAMGRCGG